MEGKVNSFVTYTEIDLDTCWNNAIKESMRIINANSKTGVHNTFSDAAYLIEESRRVKIVSGLKALLK